MNNLMYFIRVKKGFNKYNRFGFKVESGQKWLNLFQEEKEEVFDVLNFFTSRAHAYLFVNKMVTWIDPTLFNVKVLTFGDEGATQLELNLFPTEAFSIKDIIKQ